MSVRLLIALSGLVMLGGCATSPEACDPYNRDASLVTKLACDAGGGYRARVDAGERQVKLDQQENALFRKIDRQITEQQRATRNELRVTNTQHYELERDLQALVAKLQQRTQDQLGLQHRLNELERQMDAGPGTSDAEPETLAQRQARLEALQQQVNRLQQSLGYTP
ncbi:hypothetical protein [Halomonas saccharevitans]|uniref:Lipoprotein n=1 Tax=Halomonas saccharevitans TaxID=416872 RepID=A0A1I7BWZ8_9GAMM|nr:hypothetical protein [Halomonas saccharevitans]SFT91641.1 hypothetical protein SAMN04487956_13129 [Halomonas saccharevitans]